MKNILISIITLICTIQIGCGDMETPEPQPVNWDDVEKITYLFCTPGSENLDQTNLDGLTFPRVMQYRLTSDSCLRKEWITVVGWYSEFIPLIPQPSYFSGYRNVTFEYILPEYQEVGELKEGQIIITLEEWHTIPRCPECPNMSGPEGDIYIDHKCWQDKCMEPELVEEHVETITIVFDIKEAYFDGGVLDIRWVKKVSFDEKIVD